MLSPKTLTKILAGIVLIFGAGIALYGCPGDPGVMGTEEAANKTYVPPGEHDEYYAFLSGGYSGQLSVWGLPSGRKLNNIPVFSQDPQRGYGYSEETKPLLNTSYGFIPWDDSHHNEMSLTDAEPDGRWMFINANNTPRVARIDLETLTTVEILELPNTGGNHASTFATENTEYLIGATRFSIPSELDLDVPIHTYSDNFNGLLSFISVDDQTGELGMDFQVEMPPYHYDLGRAGKGVSSDWVFFTSYNTEEAHTLLEIQASEFDKDYIVAINWRELTEYVHENGLGEMVDADYYHNYKGDDKLAVSEHKDEVLVVQPDEIPEDVIFFLPTPKSPHGVDISPDGELIVAGGKLATVIPVHSFSNMIDAIENERFEERINGVPVLEYEATIAGEVEDPGLGPLHTEFDGRGNAYTSVYISSEIVKWSLDDFTVTDRIDSYYSIGHLMITGGDTPNPHGDYLLGLTKTTRDRYLPTGPKQNHPVQMYDISGENMELLLDFPSVGEPHYAQAVSADLISGNFKQIYDLDENTHPHKIESTADMHVERDGNTVRVYMASIRSHFAPDNIEGITTDDTVYVHLTNVEQDWDMVHGLAIKGMNTSEILVPPGDTQTIKWTPKRTGIYPFYCTAFCSALHQEMQGYIRVSDPADDVELSWDVGGEIDPEEAEVEL